VPPTGEIRHKHFAPAPSWTDKTGIEPCRGISDARPLPSKPGPSKPDRARNPRFGSDVGHEPPSTRQRLGLRRRSLRSRRFGAGGTAGGELQTLAHRESQSGDFADSVAAVQNLAALRSSSPRLTSTLQIRPLHDPPWEYRAGHEVPGIGSIHVPSGTQVDLRFMVPMHVLERMCPQSAASAMTHRRGGDTRPPPVFGVTEDRSAGSSTCCIADFQSAGRSFARAHSGRQARPLCSAPAG
jgi:hypothetical protein